ncbi:hypothetical protein R3P38DRAFT_2377176, partial [Favolaschia claudopus]
PSVLPSRLNTKKISELKLIASAMTLPTNLNKGPLLKSILAHMKNNPQLSLDPRFQPLFGHRTAQGVVPKTSAQKSAEEKEEDAKGETPTGANKELLDQNFKTDPPPQFKKVGA